MVCGHIWKGGLVKGHYACLSQWRERTPCMKFSAYVCGCPYAYGWRYVHFMCENVLAGKLPECERKREAGQRAAVPPLLALLQKTHTHTHTLLG